MGKPTVYTDAVNRASAAVGGEARLAATLHVPVEIVRRWLKGTVYPSTATYQKLLDLLISVGKH